MTEEPSISAWLGIAIVMLVIVLCTPKGGGGTDA